MIAMAIVRIGKAGETKERKYSPMRTTTRTIVTRNSAPPPNAVSESRSEGALPVTYVRASATYAASRRATYARIAITSSAIGCRPPSVYRASFSNA